MQANYSTRSYASTEYWIHFEHAVTVFTRSNITPPKVTDLDEIWSTLRLRTLSGLALADFGHDPRSSETWRARRNFCFFLSGKERTTNDFPLVKFHEL